MDILYIIHIFSLNYRDASLIIVYLFEQGINILKIKFFRIVMSGEKKINNNRQKIYFNNNILKNISRVDWETFV